MAKLSILHEPNRDRKWSKLGCPNVAFDLLFSNRFNDRMKCM